MSTTPDPGPLTAANVRIEPLTPKRYGEDFKLLHEFLGTMRCCCCIPNSCGESEAGWTKKREKWPADKLSLSAVAIDEATNKVVGFVHCSGFGHPCDMHSPKEHEIYVDEVMVEESLRRRGIGTQLMNWVEDTARSRGATTLSLLVLKGNPSRGLYERLGYVSKGPPGGALIACCCYGLFFGSCGAEMMYKQLPDVAAEPGSEAIARE